MKRISYPQCCRPHAVVLMLAAVLLLFGCSRGGPSSNISSAAFDSASPDVKQLWHDGLSAWKGQHYAEAATSFMSLQGKAASLSTQQMDELNRAKDEFGQAAFAA